MNWLVKGIMTAVRYLLLTLDLLVYSLIRVFYNLFMAISQIRLFSSDGTTGLIEEIATRLYALIGVYALFKITFILINMLINPESAVKGDKSAGKLATRIVVMLALIIAVPWVFDLAYEFQDIVLRENVIGTVLLGESPGSDYTNTEEKGVDVGEDVANEVFSSFVTIDSGALQDADAKNNLFFDDSGGLRSSTDVLTSEASSCEKSYSAIQTISDSGIAGIFPHIGTTYKGADGDQFCINYSYLISLIAGGFAAYVFVVYCLDIGLRVAKMAFYQLIAPVPIVTYVDGKKDGPFNKWLSGTISTYADIFVRLIIINFIILIIRDGIPDLMDMPSLQNFDFFTRNFAKAAVILGLLMFATKAPGLIKDLFGGKGDGSSYGLSMNKRVGEMAGGKYVSGVASMAGGMAKSTALLAGGAVAGGAAALAVSSKDALKAGKGNKMAAFKDAFGKNATKNLKGTGNKFSARTKAYASEMLGRFDKGLDKSGKYTDVRGKDLARQTITGNVNAVGGIGPGRFISDAQQALSHSLAYQQAAKNKPKGLSAVGTISARLNNGKANLNADRMKWENLARSGDHNAYEQLKLRDPNFNAKKAFESYLKDVGINPDFQDLPSSTDSAQWEELTNKFTAFSTNMKGFTTDDLSAGGYTQAEREAVQAYAEKVLGDLKKEVDTLSKKG